MSTIIRDLPFFSGPIETTVGGQRVVVKPDQIIIWVSLAEPGLRELHPDTPRFPAVLDTGCNQCFIMREQHLVEWAGIHPQYLYKLAPRRIYGSIVPQLAADVWLHPNRPGNRDELADSRAHPVETDRGVAVVPKSSGHSNPRLPLLGLAALRLNHLCLVVDGHRRSVTIRTRQWFWPFG